MRHFLFFLPLFLFVACSEDRPIAPASKATQMGLGGLLETFEPSEDDEDNEEPTDESSGTDTTSALEDSPERFNIEVVYLGSFSQEQKRWIEEIAQQWEMFFYDMDDVTLPGSQNLRRDGVSISLEAGDVIDDIRIYVSKFTPDMQQISHRGWSGTTTIGLTYPLLYREGSGIPLAALISINAKEIENGLEFKASQNSRYRNQKDRYRQMYWRDAFHHELGHAFGIGGSFGWLDNIYWDDINNPFFAGINAKKQMEQIAALMPEYPNLYDPRGILLEKVSFGGEPPYHFLWLGRGSFRQYFLHENGAPNVTRVTLGAFEDIGWHVNYEPAYPTLVFTGTLRCWDDEGNFRLCE